MRAEVHMKNAASIASLVCLGMKVILFVFFFKDLMAIF
jgi:hypothetical protein